MLPFYFVDCSSWRTPAGIRHHHTYRRIDDAGVHELSREAWQSERKDTSAVERFIDQEIG